MTASNGGSETTTSSNANHCKSLVYPLRGADVLTTFLGHVRNNGTVEAIPRQLWVRTQDFLGLLLGANSSDNRVASGKERLEHMSSDEAAATL